MPLERRKLARAFKPEGAPNLKDAVESQYYIDFSDVRGAAIIEQMRDQIDLFDDTKTCQLFAGHIGGGKSTELSKLQEKLEEDGFHVVMFESDEEFNNNDVKISSILLAIAKQVSESCEKIGIYAKPKRFEKYLKGAVNLLKSEVKGFSVNLPGDFQIGAQTTDEEVSLSAGIAEVTVKAKENSDIRAILDNYVGTDVLGLIDLINNDLLAKCIEELQKKGKRGLVVIVDNLERIDRIGLGGQERFRGAKKRSEFIFLDNGQVLKGLNCHLIYTMPMLLCFADSLSTINNIFGVSPQILPMVQVINKDKSSNEEGIEKLRQMILARAFPEVSVEIRKNPEQRKELILQLFDEPETLDLICKFSGGHVRNLLRLISDCIKTEFKFPQKIITRQLVEAIVVKEFHSLKNAINPREWEMLIKVANTTQEDDQISGEDDYLNLIQVNYIYEYRNDWYQWYDVNPILQISDKFPNSHFRQCISIFSS